MKQPSLLPLSKDDEVLDDEEELGVLDGERIEEQPDELTPQCFMDVEDVERLNVPYSTRSPGDWISSGTLVPMETEPGRRPARYFETWDEAEVWARGFFGDRFKGRVFDAFNSGSPRWAFIIKGPRGVHV